MLMVRLIRSGQGDMLAIKLNHTCTDGAGAKEYLPLLAHIYSCIDENGSYEPKPHARSRKDHEKIFRALGIKFPLLDNSLVEAPYTVWPFPWERSLPKFSWKPEWQTDETCFAIHRLPYGQLDLLHKYGKERGATINDLILTEPCSNWPSRLTASRWTSPYRWTCGAISPIKRLRRSGICPEALF